MVINKTDSFDIGIKSYVFVLYIYKMKLRLQELMTKKDFTNVKLSELAGVGTQQITYYKSGARKPPLETLDRLALALGCDSLELLEPGDDYAHFYDPQTGDWLGIRKKQ